MVDLKVVYKGKALLFFWCGLLALHYARNSGSANTQGTHAHTQLQVTRVKVKLKQGNVWMSWVFQCCTDGLETCKVSLEQFWCVCPYDERRL